MKTRRETHESIKSQKKKKGILQKAMKLFLRKGYEATSINDICWVAKLTKPMLYYYFPGKDHLLFSIHMGVLEKIMQPYLEKAYSIKDPAMRLQTMLKDYTKIICSRPELRFLLHESLRIKDKNAAEIRKEYKKHYLLLCETISELQASGKITINHKPSWVALLLLGMISWISFWFDYNRKGQIDEIANLVMELAFHGVGSEEIALE